MSMAALKAARLAGHVAGLATFEGELDDFGTAHKDVAVWLTEHSDERAAALAEVGFPVDAIEEGYVLEPDTKARGYGRLCAVLKMVEVLREAGLDAKPVHRACM